MMRLHVFLIGFLFIVITPVCLAEAILVEVSEGLRYTWGTFPQPPKTIDGPQIRVKISPIDDVESATVSIDVWKFRIEEIKLLNTVFKVDFEQQDSVVTFTVSRNNNMRVLNALYIDLVPTYTEPHWQEHIKTFGQFKILEAEFELKDGVEERDAAFRHGSWYVMDDYIQNGWSVHLYSANDKQPIEGVYVQLVGLDDTPNLYPIDANKYGLPTDESGYSFALLPDFDRALLNNGNGFPVWFYLEFPDGSPYQSQIVQVHSNPPDYPLDFDLYVEIKSDVKLWELYQ